MLNLKEYLNKPVEEVIAELDAQGIEYEYEEENEEEDVIGAIYIPAYWADHTELTVYEGIIDCVDDHEWE